MENILKIDNPYQAEATKYTPSLSNALGFKNEHQIEALKSLKEQKAFEGHYFYENIQRIDNHCQSDAIKDGHSLYDVLDMKCAGVSDTLDF